MNKTNIQIRYHEQYKCIFIDMWIVCVNIYTVDLSIYVIYIYIWTPMFAFNSTMYIGEFKSILASPKSQKDWTFVTSLTKKKWQNQAGLLDDITGDLHQATGPVPSCDASGAASLPQESVNHSVWCSEGSALRMWRIGERHALQLENFLSICIVAKCWFAGH